MVNAQEWLDENYPKEIRKKVNNLDFRNNDLEDKLDIDDWTELKSINCSSTVLKMLSLSNLPNLVSLSCEFNQQLSSLAIINCPKIESLFINYNKSLNNLEFLKSDIERKLTTLFLSGNEFDQDLEIFSKFINLEKLNLSKNKFCGSLKPLKNLVKLRLLIISDNNLDSDLEYLPSDLENYLFSESKEYKKTNEELFLYGGNLKAWQEAHPELMKKAGKSPIVNSYNSEPLSVTSIPTNLLSENKIQENYSLVDIDCSKISLRDNRPFSWEVNQTKLSSAELPIKLYNIKENKVEWSKGNHNVRNYAILSYVWGSRRNETLREEINVIYQKENEEDEKKLTMTKWGKKALEKAKNVCQLLNIDYLWMDQLCIDQTSIEEQNQEVPKMGIYYGNAEVTLIPINIKNDLSIGDNKKFFVIETLKKIVNSQWFTRSWTFQEGWLSKQTLFMFDDMLVDGRLLANVWSSLPEVIDSLSVNSRGELKKDSKTFITPLGATYGVNQKKVNLGLFQSLYLIKNRERGMVIDGIYSILGLLPYGEQVSVDYKPKICSECTNQEETNDCQHEDKNKKRATYTKEDLDKALMEVIKVAEQNGYFYESLSWFGPHRQEPNLWKIPEVDEEKGSTNIYETIQITDYGLKKVEFIENGIKLIGYCLTISSVDKYCRDNETTNSLKIVFNLGKKNINCLLRGTEETLRKIESGDNLVVPKQNWGRIIPLFYSAFSILVPKKCGYLVDMLEIKMKKQNVNDIERELKLLSIELDIINKKITTEDFKEKMKERILNIRRQNLPKNDVFQSNSSVNSWKNIHSNFTLELVKGWQELGFTFEQTRGWINIGLKPTDYNFCAWLKDNKQLTPEKTLNHGSLEQLNQEFFNWWQEQKQAQIEQPPK